MPIAPRQSPLFDPLLLLAALLACCVPTLLAYNQPPSATLLNQCVAVALWGGVAVVLPASRLPRSAWALLAALLVVAAGALGSWAFGALPLSLALVALGLLGGAALMVVVGASAAQGGRGPTAFAALAAGLLLGGVLGAAVAGLQVFAPDWTDGDWIAHTGLPGRAVGNLRQPNHLGTLLLWALVAAAALRELGWLRLWALWALALPLVLALELTASRTGAVGLGLLLVWGLLDRRLSRGTRLLLIATPLLYALAWAAMAWYGEFSQQALGAGARLAAEGGSATSADSPNSRLNIWRNTLALIAAQPWAGVGFGEFNFAWSLSAFANRPTAFFDHCHNLLLQLAVELGVPAATLVTALLLLALWQGLQRARRSAGADGVLVRAGLLLVLVALLHSLVEYPLWYAYFLLPTALAWGLVLGVPLVTGATSAQHAGSAAGPAAAASATSGPPATVEAGQGTTRGTAWGSAAGLLMAAAGALALLDYQHAVAIYAPPADSAPLDARIASGQRSWLFAHHADYAAATNPVPAGSAALGLRRGPHALLDTRLMIAWAQQLAGQGDAAALDRARWLAQRLREFHNADADSFFAACDGGATAAFQCQAPLRAHGWREFLR